MVVYGLSKVRTRVFVAFFYKIFCLFVAPCPPEAVDVQMDCSSGVMTVTWAANPDAESFHVRATSGVDSLSCNSTATSCSIRSLPCGHSYSVTVTADRDGCESQPSPAVNVSSGNLYDNTQINSIGNI